MAMDGAGINVSTGGADRVEMGKRAGVVVTRGGKFPVPMISAFVWYSVAKD